MLSEGGAGKPERDLLGQPSLDERWLLALNPNNERPSRMLHHVSVFLPINLPALYRVVNQRVEILRLLDRLRLTGGMRYQDGEKEYVGCCPLHGGSTFGEFVVSSENNTWVCYGTCQRAGFPLDFVALKERVPYAVAAIILQGWFEIPIEDVHPERFDLESVGQA